MANRTWSDNKYEGLALRKMFKRLQTRADKNANNLKLQLVISHELCYIAATKGHIAKSEKERELEERLKKLEELAGLVQKTAPVTK